MALVVNLSNLMIKKIETEASDAKSAAGDNEASTASGKGLVTEFLAQESQSSKW